MKRNSAYFIILVSCSVVGSLFAGESSERGASSSRRLSNENDKALLDAANRGDFKVVETLLRSRGVNVNAVNSDGRTALMLAAAKGHVEIVKLLLDARANVDVVDFKGQTALDFAANPAVVNELKKYDALSFKSLVTADDQISRVGPTRVLLAFSSHKGVEGVKLADKAIRFGANLCAKNAAGDTALTLAVKADNVGMVQLLFDKMEWKVTKDGGRVVIGNRWSCLGVDEFRAVQSLAKDSKIQELFAIKMREMVMAFFKAAINGDIEAISKLRDEGVDVNVVNWQGKNALMFAVSNGHAETVELLLDGGVDVNARDGNGQTALDIALQVAPKNPLMVKLLRDHGMLTASELRERAAAHASASSH